MFGLHFHMLQSIIKGHQSRRSGQESGGRNCRRHGGGLTLHHLPAFLYNPDMLAPRWYHPQQAGPSYLSHQSRECPADLSTFSQSDEDIFSVGIPSLGDSTLCQIGKNLTSTSPGWNEALELSRFITPLVTMAFVFTVFPDKRVNACSVS